MRSSGSATWSARSPREIGAELILRRDPGTIGPVRIEGLAPAEAFRRLAGRHSLVLEFRGGRIARVMLIAAREATIAAPRSVVAKAAREACAGAPSPRSPELDARNRQATTIRDIVKLSYRHDDEAVAELAAIAATSADPAVRGAAVSALAGVGGKKAARLIATSGLVDRDPQVRLRAAQGLWLAGGADAGARLRSAAKREPDAEVRVAIERLLRDGPPRGGGGQGGPHPARPTR